MKFQYILLTCLFLTGCASFETGPDGPDSIVRTSTDQKSSVQTPTPMSRGTVWELLSDHQVTLYFKDVDKKSRLTVILKEGVTLKPVPVGHWQLTGFERGGKSFVSMNTSRKFVFRMKPKAMIYSGSYLIACPAISSKDYKVLKQMKFFNRYPFSSNKGLCEVVVGNNLENVKEQFGKKMKNHKVKLQIGF